MEAASRKRRWGASASARWGAARGMASLNAKRVHFRSEGERAALGAAPDGAKDASDGFEMTMTEFEHYMRLHGKSKQTYCSRREGGAAQDVRACEATLSRAEASFRRNQRIVAQHNADPANTFKLRLNKFADVDSEDFQASQLRYSARPMSKLRSHHQNAKRFRASLRERNVGAIGRRSNGVSKAFQLERRSQRHGPRA